MSVGPDNLPGFDRVHALADYLVELRGKNQALSDQQVKEITNLWNDLVDYDKSGTVFSARYKKTQLKGRFRATKTTVSAGVESVGRYQFMYHQLR